MTPRTPVLFWLLLCAGLFGVLFLLSDMLLPFILGIAVAYLLNPAVSRLTALGLSRSLSALAILGVFFAGVSFLLLALIPVLYKQLYSLALEIPGYVDTLRVLVEPFSEKILTVPGQENGIDIRALVREHGGEAWNAAAHVWQGLAAGGQAATDFISVLVFMPIVAYFMMKEWNVITRWIEDLLPHDHRSTILDLFKKIDRKLSGFVRGQISVALLLGAFYAVALSLAGLKYGFLLGLGSGLLSIIPMVGSFVGLIVSVGVACFQWLPEGEWVRIAIVAAIFVSGQLVEGNFLTPKLVGESVGLHPLWVFFALLAGGSLFGIVGMLLAVPVAAVAGVLIGFGLSRYKASALYRGNGERVRDSLPDRHAEDGENGTK